MLLRATRSYVYDSSSVFHPDLVEAVCGAEYVIDKIVDSRPVCLNGEDTIEYRIRWLNFPEAYDEWKPAFDVPKEVIDIFKGDLGPLPEEFVSSMHEMSPGLLLFYSYLFLVLR